MNSLVERRRSRGIAALGIAIATLGAAFPVATLAAAQTGQPCSAGEPHREIDGVTYGCLDGALEALVDASPPIFIPGDGTFLVGLDIPPGTYKSAPAEQGLPCQWWTQSDLADATSQTGFDSSNGQTYATIRPTDESFHTQFCASWYKIR